MTSSRSRKKSKIIALAFFFVIMIPIGLPNSMALPVFYDVNIPGSADTGQLINITVNITSTPEVDEVILRYSNPATGQVIFDIMVLTAGNISNGTWSFEVPALPYEGSIEYGITAKDFNGTSAQYPPGGTGTIQITGEKPPKEFPWNLVIIVVFLAVAMIATELIFKPGFYRPTGRQRAKALEEEDRKKEQEESEEEPPNTI
ncbi:MAG: hypothetical protein Q7J68_07130 [Thermoplasmata archaeon]|nr:hypothetical protein [Thermoplasmata archaeon]